MPSPTVVTDPLHAHRQRRGTPILLAADLHTTEPANQIDQLVLSLAIDQALATLTHAHRQAVISVLRHRTTAETAKILGIPEGTVKSRIHYGVRALRKALDGPHPTRRTAAA